MTPNPRMHRSVIAAFLLCLLAIPLMAGSQVAVRAIGEITQQNGVWHAGTKPASLVIGEPDLRQCRVRLEVLLAPAAGIGRNTTELVVMPEELGSLAKDAALRLGITRDKDGRTLSFRRYQFSPDTGKWGLTRESVTFNFLPDPKDPRPIPPDAPRSWQGRWLTIEIEADGAVLRVWMEGRLVKEIARPAEVKGPLVLNLAPGEQARNITVEPIPANGRFLAINLGAYANLAQPLRQPGLNIDGVPFAFTGGILDLRNVGWIDWQQDPRTYREFYDAGAPFLDDQRMPMLRIPAADYTAAHVLAVADADPSRTPMLSLRAGRYGQNGLTVQHDFSAVVSRAGAAKAVDTPAGQFYPVRVPLTTAFAQDIDEYFDIEITKEIRLAVRQDDAARHRFRPLGLPSGVRIAAITFEKSPLQMRITGDEPGHAFEEPQQPAFNVQLTNITGQAQRYRLTADARSLDAKTARASAAGSVKPGETVTVPLTVPAKARGYYDLTVTLADGRGNVLLRRQTSFAVLPPDTRTHRDTSPFGTWDFYGGHASPNDPAILGPLYRKLGMRYGMFHATTEDLQKYGVIYGTEPVTIGEKAIATYERSLARLPGYVPPALVFHEHSISLPHIVRVPDLFTDRPPYRLNEAEEKRFKDLWELAVQGAQAIRAKYPQTHIAFGNGSLPLKEEFYRHGFPADLFDSAGNESPSGSSLPEAQPPNYVVNNSSLWMERQLLDHYGYKDKAITQCYEICYPNTNPGNLAERTQADYFVRHALHSLAWGMPQIRMGLIADVGNSYYFSGWGASGFCHGAPDVNVKPSFVAFATLTRVLDGAKYVRDLPAGSPSLYLLEFARPDGKTAYALWTIRGQRPVTLTVDGGAWTLVNDQGRESAVAVADGKLTATASSSPVYLVGNGKVTAVVPGAPAYADKPEGKVSKLSLLDSMDEWQVEPGRSQELETFNPMSPRRPGRFTFTPVKSFEGKEGVLKVTPQPLGYGKPTMPMYAVLAHKTGIPIPGKPTEIGLWVNGNSGWGRVTFEFKDASGQRWISIGKESKDIAERYKVPGVSGWFNDDGFGFSSINFDGWRYIGFPLPGNYPGVEAYGWPSNCLWRRDGDGVVHYPLTVTKLVVELPEKVLHVQDYTPAPWPDIYLRDLVACEGTIRSGE